MSAAAELLATLRGQGFALAAEGDRIRITPAGRLTAELRTLIRRHKAELLAALDAAELDAGAEAARMPTHPAELLAHLDALTADPGWAKRWAVRLRGAKWADLDAVRRTVRLMVDLAAERHRAGDAADFRGWCRFILDHAAGRHWDAASRRPVVWPADVVIIDEAEAAATFADVQAVRHRSRSAKG